MREESEGGINACSVHARLHAAALGTKAGYGGRRAQDAGRSHGPIRDGRPRSECAGRRRERGGRLALSARGRAERAFARLPGQGQRAESEGLSPEGPGRPRDRGRSCAPRGVRRSSRDGGRAPIFDARDRGVDRGVDIGQRGAPRRRGSRLAGRRASRCAYRCAEPAACVVASIPIGRRCECRVPPGKGDWVRDR